MFNSAKVAQRLLAMWMAKKIDDDMFNRVINTESPTTLQAGNVSGVGNLGATHVMTPDELDRVKLQLQSFGALPFDVLMDNGQERPMYGIVISEVSEYQLKSNSKWNQSQRDAGIRGQQNKLFTGAIGQWNGMIVYTLPTIQVSNSKFGSYLRPEAPLNGSLDDSSTTVTVGAGDSSVDYTQYFPQSGTFNIKVDGSDEIMEASAHTNTTFTVTRGAQSTTAESHSDDAIVSLASDSVTRERAIGFGAEMAVRTWAVLPTNQNELQDYRFKFGIGIEAAYGQKAVVDTNSAIPNYVLLNLSAPRP